MKSLETLIHEYLERHYEVSNKKVLYDTYSFNDDVCLSELMELAIVYSDNPSSQMMREYLQNVQMKMRKNHSRYFKNHGWFYNEKIL